MIRSPTCSPAQNARLPGCTDSITTPWASAGEIELLRELRRERLHLQPELFNALPLRERLAWGNGRGAQKSLLARALPKSHLDRLARPVAENLYLNFRAHRTVHDLLLKLEDPLDGLAIHAQHDIAPLQDPIRGAIGSDIGDQDS
jgi:hypothetical protein